MTSKAEEVLSGFQINWMRIRDDDSKSILWESNEDLSLPGKEHEARISKQVTECKLVWRELNFSSVEPITKLKLEQKIFFKKKLLDEWCFDFGEVAPDSTNTWLSSFEATSEAPLIPANTLSGNIWIETNFYDDELLFASSRLRLYYV